MGDWPPPVNAATVWFKVRLRGGTPVKVRRVRLWGQRVYVDAEGRVFCDGCGEFVTVAELTTPDNSHPVGPVRRAAPLLLPQATDDPPRGDSLDGVGF